MDTRSFYGRKRNATYRMAGGAEGESDEEVAVDSDSEYLPEEQSLAQENDLAEEEDNCPGNDVL